MKDNVTRVFSISVHFITLDDTKMDNTARITYYRRQRPFEDITVKGAGYYGKLKYRSIYFLKIRNN